MTPTRAHLAAIVQPPRAAAKRRDARPAAPDHATGAIASALVAIARATPSPLLAPWLPGALGALSGRGEQR